MKKLFLTALVVVGLTSAALADQKNFVTHNIVNQNEVIVAFNVNGKVGELRIDPTNNQLISGWVSWPAYGQYYYNYNITSISGYLAAIDVPIPGGPGEPEIPVEPTWQSNEEYTHFVGTIYFNGNNSLSLDETNSSVLREQ